MFRLPALCLVAVVLAGCSGDEATSSAPTPLSTIGDPATDAQACFEATKLHLLLTLNGNETSEQAYDGLVSVAGEVGAPVRAFNRTLPLAFGELTRNGEDAAVELIDGRVMVECRNFTAELRPADRTTAPPTPPPVPEQPLPLPPPPPGTSGDVYVPDLADGCDAILIVLARDLASDPDATIRAMGAAYGRAGSDVVGAAARAAQDPLLLTDPEAVIGRECPPGS